MTTLQLIKRKDIERGELENYVLFGLGKFVSMFGSSIYTFAIGLYVLELTGSGLNFAMTLVFATVPMVIAIPFAGVLADRFNKKKLVVAMDLLNGALFLLVYRLSFSFELNLGMIYGTTFFMAIFTSIFSVCLETAKPNIVTPKMLMNLNSTSRIIDSISAISGPVVGGLVFAFIDIRLFILFNGLSFILSAISEMFINFNFNVLPEGQGKESLNFLEELKEGARYIKGTKSLLPLFATFVFINFFIGFSINVPLPFIITNVLALESRYYGIIQSGFPTGMIVGALFVKRIRERIPYSRLLRIMTNILSLGIILIGLPLLWQGGGLLQEAYLLYYSVIVAMIGGTIALIDIPLMYELQTIVPAQYRGRVLSIGISVGKIILPAGLILSGGLVNHLPVVSLPIVGGVLLFSLNWAITRFSSKRFNDSF